MLTALRGRSRELGRTAGGVLYPVPNPGVADGGLLLYKPLPYRPGAEVALTAPGTANTEALTTILAAASAPTTPYWLTHLAATRSATANAFQTMRVRGLGTTLERWVNLTTVLGGTEGSARGEAIEPELPIAGGVGIEVGLSSSLAAAGAAECSAVARMARPSPYPSGLPSVSGQSNYRYPLAPATSDGRAVTSTTTQWVAGAYAELVASLPGTWFALRAVTVRKTDTGSFGDITLANAAAGVEAGYEFAAFPVLKPFGAYGGTVTYRLPVPIMLQGGTRLAVKAASQGTAALTFYASIIGHPVPYTEAI